MNDSNLDTVRQKRIFRRLRSQLAIVLPAVALVVAGFVVAYQFVAPAPPTRVVMATGSASGAYQAFGKRYAEHFARQGVELVLQPSAGSIENLDALTMPDSTVDIAFLQGGIGNAGDHPDLQSLGSVYYEPFWVFVRSQSQPRRLTELKGKRVAIGAEGSGTRAVALTLLADNGVTSDNTDLHAIGSTGAAKSLRLGDIDAAIFVTSVTSKIVRGLLGTPGIALMNFERADAYVRRNNFLSKVVLPKGIVDLAQNLPADDTVLLAPSATIVAAPHLHPALIDLMLMTMSKAHKAGGHLEAIGEFPSDKFLTYPMAPAAEQFYKRGPPLLQRYLPFWAANLIDRLKIMLLPLLTLLYPLFKILPPAYNWRMQSKISRWYKDLQAMDDELHAKAITPDEARALLDRIEDAVEQMTVPVTFASNAYTLRLHIEFLRRKVDDLPG